jgi:hypothetical protein
MVLRAATAYVGGGVEVRLRWLMTEGWIPEGRGFNVYKIVNGVRQGPLNPSPLLSSEQRLTNGGGGNQSIRRMMLTMPPSRIGGVTKFGGTSSPGPTKIGGGNISFGGGGVPLVGPSKQDLLLNLYRTARQVPPGVDRKELFQFLKAPSYVVQPAGPAFKLLKAQINQYVTSKPNAFLPINRALRASLDSSLVKPYATKLGLTTEMRRKLTQSDLSQYRGPGGVNQVVPFNRNPEIFKNQTFTPFMRPTTRTSQISTGPTMHTMMAIDNKEPVKRARTILAVGALTSPSIADGLGLSFTDTQVQRGSSVEYVLSFVRSGGDSIDVANATLAVGSDTQPTSPSGLDATQIGPNAVALYWSPVDEAVSQQLMLPSYRIVRVDSIHPDGIDVNGQPVLKSAQLAVDGSGQMVEPLFSFQDLQAPVGPVTYRVTMLDAFGRESSAPATVSLTVGDWATPSPVTKVKVQLTSDKMPQVLWTASSDPDCKYRIYRADPGLMAAQGSSYTPTLIADMVAGTPIFAKGKPLSGLLAMNGPQIPRQRRFQNIDIIQKDRLVTGLGLETYLSYVDASAVRDRYYRYIVTAVYPRNGRDSESRLSESIGVPLLAGPPSPTGLAAKFSILNKLRRSSANYGRLYNFAVAPEEITLVHLPPKFTFSPKVTSPTTRSRFVSSQETKFWGNVPQLPTPNYAAQINLTWRAPTGPGAPFTYRVFRQVQPQAQESLRFKVLTDVKLDPVIKSLGNMFSSPGTPGTAPSNGKLSPGLMPRQTSSNMLRQQSIFNVPPVRFGTTTSPAPPRGGGVSKIGTIDIIQNGGGNIRFLTGNEPTLVGETTQTTINDGFLSAAVGQDVEYTVIAKNQWGIESDPVRIMAHAGPSLPPSVPTLVSATPNPARPDQAMLTVTANPLGEEVSQYVVLRKSMPPPARNEKRTIWSSRLKHASLATSMANNKLQPTQAKLQVIRTPLITAPTSRPPMNGGLSPGLLGSVLVELSDYTPVASNALTVVPDGGLMHIIDSSTQPDAYYSYRVEAVNSSGLQSDQSGYMDTGTRLASLPAPVLGAPSKSPDGITLNVAGIGSNLVIVERAVSVNGVDTEFIQVLGPASAPLLDRTVLSGQTYKYQVRTVSPSGISSPLSNTITVTY